MAAIPFPTLRTERLLLRVPRVEDTETIVGYRSDPEIARYQDWEMPYDAERGAEKIAKCAEQGGPVVDGGWNLTIATPDDSQVVGDLYCGLTWGGRSAEIGYTLASGFHGHGYATEAAGELIRWLFEDVEGIGRIESSLDPLNVASAAVLERLGFEFEGQQRKAFWVGDENSDDGRYGLLRSDWEEWNARPKGAPESVRLVEITEANQHAVRKLRVHRSQEQNVAPVVASMADALFPEIIDGAPVVPWMRAVEADGELAGFVMIAEVTEAHPEPYLWRLLVDRRHQRRGVGERIIELVVDKVRADGATSLLTSYVEGKGSPKGFYAGLGFVETGEIVDDETEARLTLS